MDYDKLRNIEHDAALGNGGLGRLAACFMESMATLCIAAHGYGIRYDHGMFRQVIKDGWQHEYPENWLAFGNPWEVSRSDVCHPVGFGGTVETQTAFNGEASFVWHPAETVAAVAYDTPVVGWRGHFANTLRLWSAWATDPLRLDAFNRGDHMGALESRARANSISQVLYPSDDTPSGQELRLRQEYFFTSASLQDLVARHIRQHGDIRTLADKAAIQLNDTHPAIAVAELMRILVDLHADPVGRGVAHHHRHDIVYQPHAAARGAGKLAGLADGAVAAAPYADRLSDQPAAPGRRLRAGAFGRPAARGAVADRR